MNPLLSEAVAYAALVAFNMETPRTGLPNMDTAQSAMKAALKALTDAGYVVVPRFSLDHARKAISEFLAVEPITASNIKMREALRPLVNMLAAAEGA